jgi:hypothetical protein
MTLKTGALGLALSLLAGTALAENVCAGAKDLTALQVAAVQQELMVAGLSCNQAGLYNSFVLSYQKDLQASDKALLEYFQRTNPIVATAEYHRFKTKLANEYSLKSLANKRAYCRNAELAFASALNEKLSLAAFALAQPVSTLPKSTACGESVPGAAMVARAPETAKRAIAGGATVAGGAAAVKDIVPAKPELETAKADPPAAKADPPALAKTEPPAAAKVEAPAAQSATLPQQQAQRLTPPPPPVTRAPDRYAPAGSGYGYGNQNGRADANPPPLNRRPPQAPLPNYRYDARDRYACESYYGRDPYYRAPYRTNDPCYEIYRWYYDRDYYRYYGAPPQQYWRR